MKGPLYGQAAARIVGMYGVPCPFCMDKFSAAYRLANHLRQRHDFGETWDDAYAEANERREAVLNDPRVRGLCAARTLLHIVHKWGGGRWSKGNRRRKRRVQRWRREASELGRISRIS